MITITVGDFVKYTEIKRDWILTKCIPVKTELAKQGIGNLYDVEHILKTVKRIQNQVVSNHNLAASKKEGALKTLNKIIIGIDKYNKLQSKRAS